MSGTSLHCGRELGKKQRKAWPIGLRPSLGDEARVILGHRQVPSAKDSTTPRLDTLFLTLPVSWRGTIAQYAGRLHRLYDGKREVRIYDYADLNVPMLAQDVRPPLPRLRGRRLHRALARERHTGLAGRCRAAVRSGLEARLFWQRAPAGQGWRRYAAREFLRSRRAGSAPRTPRAPNARGVRPRHFSSDDWRRCAATKGRFAVNTKLADSVRWRGEPGGRSSVRRTHAWRWSWMVRSISPTGPRTGGTGARTSCFRRTAISCCGFSPKTWAGNLDAVLDAILRALSHRASSGSVPLQFIRGGRT